MGNADSRGDGSPDRATAGDSAPSRSPTYSSPTGPPTRADSSSPPAASRVATDRRAAVQAFKVHRGELLDAIQNPIHLANHLYARGVIPILEEVSTHVHPGNADKFTKATLHGGIDEIMKRKEAIELKDIFKPEDGEAKVRLVLVEGAPGVGKTTLAWELCRRRHEIEALTAFSAVVLLRLREKRVQKAKSLADLLYHDDPDIQKAVAKEIHSNRGENLLLILDGFDEVPASVRKSFFLAQVINGECLPKATVLVTSRPSARADLLLLHKPHKHVEVLGFTHELIEQYASGVFGCDAVLADFLNYITINPGVKSMMYIPLNSAIVVDIYQENRKVGRPIPQTMTQLYSELILTLMSRHLNEKGDQSTQSLPAKLDRLHKEHRDVYRQLLSLAKLAYEGTLSHEVIFENLPAGCTTLGLMTTSQQLYTRRKVSANYNFFHLTVQEFLSAFYVSQLPGCEQKQAFEQFSDDIEFPHMDVVWRFVAGLTGFGAIGWELVLSRRGERTLDRVTPFVVQCLYEAQEKADSENVLGRSTVEFSSTSVLDCFAVGYCIAVSRCTWKVGFGLSHFGPELVEMLVYGLKSQEEVLGSIDFLKLKSNSIGREGMAHLRELPHKVLQQLSRLDLIECKLDGTALDLLSDITPTMTSLKHLNIDYNPAGDGGTVKLLQSLGTTSHLHTLEMGGVPIGCDDITSLSDLIRPSGGLKKLSIGDEHIQHDCVELLLKTVLSPFSVEHLTLWLVDLTASSLERLKENRNITALRFHSVTMGTKIISCIAEVLHVNTTLEELKFLFASFSSPGIEDGLRDLSRAFKVNKSLKVLSISQGSLYDTGPLPREGVRSLVGALQYNQTLERLQLPRYCRNHFSQEELRAMDKRVGFDG